MKIYLNKVYMVNFEGGGFMAMNGAEVVARLKHQIEHGYKLPTNIKNISSPLPDKYIN